jgi:hypothetical protein
MRKEYVMLVEEKKCDLLFENFKKTLNFNALVEELQTSNLSENALHNFFSKFRDFFADLEELEGRDRVCNSSIKLGQY